MSLLLVYQYRTSSFLEFKGVLSAIFPTPVPQHIIIQYSLVFQFIVVLLTCISWELKNG